MSVVLMVGNHSRHAFIANCLHAQGQLKGLVIEKREAFLPSPPKGISESIKTLYVRHFQERDESEVKHFGAAAEFPTDVPVLEVRCEELNGERVRAFVANIQARLLLSYGVHMLSQETLAASSARYRWNLHGGLSPWYRGCITHFWPSYLLEPQMTGFIVHELTDSLDHGPVIHQSGTTLVRGDGLHDLACRAVLLLAEQLPQLIELTRGDDIKSIPHKTSGRLWLARDWRPEHLQLIYEHYGNRIVDLCLDGKITGREPELISQW